MEIKYPCNSANASELATVNRSNCFDGIVKLSDFEIEVLTDSGIASGTGYSEISVSAGECWIAGRYWRLEEKTIIKAPFSTQKQLVKIKCDTTGIEPVEFSIYVSADEPINGVGIYEIPIGAIQYGYMVEQNIPLSNGGEFPGVKIYNGDREGFIRVRKVSCDIAELTIDLYVERYDDVTGTYINVKLPEEYRPVSPAYDATDRQNRQRRGICFVGQTGHQNVMQSINDGVAVFYISGGGDIYAVRKESEPVNNVSFNAAVMYSIERK